MEAQSLRMVRSEEGKALRKAYESGKIHHGFNEYRTAEPRNDDVSNTITTVQKDNMVLITKQLGNDQQEDICNCLTSVQKDNLILEIKNQIDEKYHNFIYEIDGDFYLIRIRKLTPKECWRLMGFTDEDFEKAASVVSNTQLYKQAGNSIVKDVLMDIFRKLLI